MPKVTAIVSRVTNRVSLVQGHEYDVIGIDDMYFRIVDESEEPALHPKSYFGDCEITPPDEWEYRDFGDGEYLFAPREFVSIGFFEDYHDGLPAAILIFREYLQKRRQ